MTPFHDLSAEIECTMVPSAMLHRADAVGTAWWNPAKPGPRRRFWCSEARREVEVEFERRRPVPWSTPGVRRCSAFEPPEAITCRRECADPLFRLQRTIPAFRGAP
jgi:hypothetical protein